MSWLAGPGSAKSQATTRSTDTALRATSRVFAGFRNHIHRWLWINDASMYITGVKVLRLYASTKLRDLVTQQDLKPIGFLHLLLVPTLQMLHLLVHHYSTSAVTGIEALLKFFFGGGFWGHIGWLLCPPAFGLIFFCIALNSQDTPSIKIHVFW